MCVCTCVCVCVCVCMYMYVCMVCIMYVCMCVCTVNPAGMVDSAMFVTHAASWLVILVQVWSQLILSTKAFHKVLAKHCSTSKSKALASDEKTVASALITHHTSHITHHTSHTQYIEGRIALRSLVTSLSTTLLELENLISKTRAQAGTTPKFRFHRSVIPFLNQQVYMIIINY